MEILKKLKNNVIVSLQASYNEPLHDENCIIAMAKTLIELGGVKVLRLAGERDIKNIKKLYPDIIVIGITKPDKIPDNYKEIVYITPNVKDCEKIIKAGADIVAFDATTRKRPDGETINDLISFIKSRGKIAMADIAEFIEAKNAFNFGVDIVSTTLSGYTINTQYKSDLPDFELAGKIKKELNVFTILEGKIWEREQAKHAFNTGIDAVVIGSAITRPHLIAKRFIDIIEGKK